MVEGYEDGNFLPGGRISRAELASICSAYCENYAWANNRAGRAGAEYPSRGQYYHSLQWGLSCALCD